MKRLNLASESRVRPLVAALLCLMSPVCHATNEKSMIHPALQIERRFRDGWVVRVLSDEQFPATGNGWVELFDPTRKPVQTLKTRPIVGVRFIERFRAKPLLQIQTYASGNGFRSVSLTWLCLDTGRLEEVLKIAEASVEFVAPSRAPRERVVTEDTCCYDVSLAGTETWPTVRCRTVQRNEITDRRPGRSVTSTKVSETEYVFDQKSRRYHAAPQRKARSVRATGTSHRRDAYRTGHAP
jgi:hypothetical protein